MSFTLFVLPVEFFATREPVHRQAFLAHGQGDNAPNDRPRRVRVAAGSRRSPEGLREVVQVAGDDPQAEWYCVCGANFHSIAKFLRGMKLPSIERQLGCLLDAAAGQAGGRGGKYAIEQPGSSTLAIGLRR